MAISDKDAITAPAPAKDGFQCLENISVAYWHSQVLFTGLELGLFGRIDQGVDNTKALAGAAGCGSRELSALVAAMEQMGLVTLKEGKICNTPAASRFLVPGKKDYMGDYFLYRQYMRPRWDQLTQKITGRKKKESSPLSYARRNLLYLTSTDTLVRQKAKQIADLLKPVRIQGKALDIGGGAGSLVRSLQQAFDIGQAVLFDLPEIIEAARILYPEETDWKGIRPMTGDFRSHEFHERFGLVCLSNFLHVYSPREARQMLSKAVSLLEDNGMLLIHDYFPDRRGAVPGKGALYDLNMMLNTYNGVCHEAQTLMAWCRESGLKHIGVKDLETDSAVITACKQSH